MDKYIGMALPPPPVGSGLDKVLSYVDSVTRHSAQSLVSLSPFIIPLLIAAALKITRWAGPLAALLAVVPVLAALLNAEKVLQEMTLMPLPDDRLKSEKKGTSVRPAHAAPVRYASVTASPTGPRCERGGPLRTGVPRRVVR